MADFRRLLNTDSALAARAVVDRLLSLHAGYERSSRAALLSAGAHNQAAGRYVHTIIDPVFATMQAIIYRNAELALTRALAKSAALCRSQNSATNAIIIAFALAVALMLAFGLIIAQFRRRLDSAHRAETVSAFEAVSLPAYGVVGPIGAAEAFDGLVEKARERIESLGDIEAHAAYGIPVEELAVYSASLDLLVVGSRGYGPLGRLMHGSTSQHLARVARSPLLVLTRTAHTSAEPGSADDESGLHT